MKIQVILGSTRPGRFGKSVANWLMPAVLSYDGFEVELVDLIDYDLPMFDEPVSPRYNPARTPSEPAQRWLNKLAEADGYIIITAEYNHSLPAALKNALDYVDYQTSKKPVAIVSYGVAGGVRATEHLKAVLSQLDTPVVHGAVELINPRPLIDGNGNWTGPDGPYEAPAMLQALLSELAWWTATLKAGRQQVAKPSA